MVSEWDSLMEYDPENEDRDGMYLCDVWNMASQHSQDPSTQVASAVVSWRAGVILAGWNEVPPQISSKGYPRCMETKNFCTEHAERRVLYKCVENRIPTQDMHLYATWAACAECARAIIQFGIVRVVTFRGLVQRTPSKWHDSIREGLTMMRDAGITVVGWSGELDTSRRLRFAGELLDKTAVR